VTSKSVGSQGSVELEETGKFESDWKEWTNQIEALKLDIARVDTGLASQEEAPKVGLIKPNVGKDELKTNQKGATGCEGDSNSFTDYGGSSEVSSLKELRRLFAARMRGERE